MNLTNASDSEPEIVSQGGHPCAYDGERCPECGEIDICLGQGVGYYDRRAIAEGRLERVD